MADPCVRVAREDGEATRQRLAAADLVDHTREIVVEDGDLYVPVTDPDAVPAEYEVVDRATPDRDQQQTPADLLGYEPGYERLGDIVIVDEDDPERAQEVADAVVDSDLPVETVLNRASKVKGDLRVRDWEILAGERTETVHREYGCSYALDLAAVYFSPRLATERHRVTGQVAAGEHVFDMFAGVGPFVIPAAKRGATCVGVDLNAVAVDYLRENARRNGVEDRVTAVAGDVRAVASGEAGDYAGGGEPRDWSGWADRIVMNLPHSADDFLDTAVALAADDCVVHYYDIQHEEDPYGPGERALRAAAERAGYDVSVETRRTVRSYAPHELNVCLDVRLILSDQRP